MADPAAPDWTFFSELVTAVAVPLQQGIIQYLGPVLVWVGPVGTALILIYVAIEFFRMAYGKVSIETVILNFIVSDAFVWLISSQATYMQWIGTPLLTALPNGIIAAFAGTTTPGGGIDRLFQAA